MHRQQQDILIVEDDAEVSLVFKLFLTDEGFHVNVARNGLIAMDKVSEHQPDLILLDLHMPVMDGEAFARKYRSEFGSDTPIIVITAVPSAGFEARIDNAQVLKKPVELDRLLEVVEQSLAWNLVPNGQSQLHHDSYDA